jgi:DNA polymerase III subunit gamma/tau
MELSPTVLRPLTLNELIGQPTIARILSNAVQNDQIASAYLFAGPRGTGKTSTARIFAKMLNCGDQPTVEPCLKCESCQGILNSTSLDVVEIDAASRNTVHDARHLIETTQFSPIQGRYRVFILDEAHQMTEAAFNALLKTLEEPPSHVVFILCTTELDKVLPTVVSRCQVFNFRAIAPTAIADHLKQICAQEKVKIDNDALLTIGRLSNGSLRDALQLLAQSSTLGGCITADSLNEMVGGISTAQMEQLFTALVNNDLISLLTTAQSIIDSGRSPAAILQSMLQVYRDLLLVKSTQSTTNFSWHLSHDMLTQIAAQLDFTDIYHGLSNLQKAESNLSKTVNAGIWLEVTLIGLVQLTDETDAEILALPQVDISNSVVPKRVAVGDRHGSHDSATSGARTAVVSRASALSRVWETVTQQAKSEKTRELMNQAQLVFWENGCMAIAADQQTLTVLRRHESKLLEFISAATGETKAAIKWRLK